MSEWFYISGGAQVGPISGSALKSLAALGEVGPDDLVWNESLPEWIAARHVRGLAFASTAPREQPNTRVTPVQVATPQYYQPSGRTPLPGALIALGIGMAAGIVVAYVYSFVDFYSPSVYFCLVLAPLAGLAVGYCSSFGARVGKLRNARRSTLLCVICASVSYLFAWTVWLWIVASRGDPGLELSWMFGHPGSFLRVLAWVYDNGVWVVGPRMLSAIGQHAPTVNGVLLVIVWLGEALTFFAAAIITAKLMFVARTYCEACGRWCGIPQVVHEYPGGISAAELKLRLEARDWASLGTLPAARYTDRSRLSLCVEACPKCPQTRLLSLLRTSIARDAQRREKKNHIVLMSKLIVSAEEVDVIRSAPPTYEDSPVESETA
ncbi:MAG TPA: DUF4339 domain-containing protein [Tepidisphaeraceae bacterium]|jgi:hypothetical protein|nr:DUF4339 domain-containing protein [Tepidisphaeraceae bacterium]